MRRAFCLGCNVAGAAERNTGMYANSQPVHSTQTQPHRHLDVVVKRHLHETFRRAPSAARRSAFAAVAGRLGQAPFVLDAGCGTGASTFALAAAHPRALVLGADKSQPRLASAQRRIAAAQAPANALLLRCDLVDFWQLAAAAGLHCERQYLLYPNPWPKPDQLKRRWHAHPVLPAMLALGGIIELRCNWRVYADEFAAALRIAGWRVQAPVRLDASDPLTPFERKYAASGHTLWRCEAAP